ncbi:MAG TPA: VCBS repeat-containing protein, partial [Polyangiaceae bacterium LLY-WYZ-15_(1-7)]|nr:VCBS repeat-containing protein [Polyangiaceae bacterium LLY-WYZ-15_(1-7)]
ACGDDDGATPTPDAGSPGVDAASPMPEDAGGLPPLELEDPADGFTRHVIDDAALGPAFGDLADLDGDGDLDIVYGHFGLLENPTRLPNGEVVIYRQGDSIEDWTREAVVRPEDALQWPNDVTFEDVDEDGDLDVLVPHGFLICNLFRRPCGGLAWFENEGGEWVRHTLIEAGNDEFYHLGLLEDLDGDGRLDLLTVAELFSPMGEGGARTVWFRGADTPERFETTPRTILADAGGSVPEPYDVDEDGDLDIVTAEFFTGTASFVWIEQVSAPTAESDGEWTRHVIDTEPGPSIEMFVVEGLFEAGDRWAVGSNHVNVHEEGIDSAIFGYRIPDGEDAREESWARTVFSEGIVAKENEGVERNAAPGIFGEGDIDGDGDTDFVVSGDGDPDVYWLEQIDGAFETHVLQPNLPQAGGMKVADLDGDGRAEILVSGYEQNVVLLFQHD